MILGVGIHGIQRAFSSLLLMLVFVVSNAPILNAFSSMQPDCGMQCCRSKKVCCCRKKSVPGKATLSARTCPPDCGRSTAGTAGGSMAAAATALAIVTQIPIVDLDLAPILVTLTVAWLCFALFQRPPPRCLLPAE